MRLLGGVKVSALSVLYCTIIILYAGMATVFTRGLGNITTLGNAFALLLTIVVMIKDRITLKRTFWVVLTVFFLYGVITTINQGRFSFLWLTKWPIMFLITYVMCQDLKGKLFVTIETVIFYLSIIDLLLWIIQVVSPSLIHTIVKLFEFSSPFSEESNVDSNMLVFTLISNYDVKEFFGILPRNSGFAWEPGAFGSYLCIGIFCNILRKNMTLRGNLPLTIMLLALLTTQSTTAIGALAVGMCIWMINGKKKVNFLWVLPLLLWIFTLPFVTDKAMAEYSGTEGFSYNQIDTNRDLTRMQSFILSWEEFKQHPILGLGGDAGGSWLHQIGYDIPIFSGIGELLSRYGLIMTFLFLFLLYKSCCKMNSLYKTRVGFVFGGMLLTIMVGFNNWNQPIFIVFWLYICFGYPLYWQNEMGVDMIKCNKQ